VPIGASLALALTGSGVATPIGLGAEPVVGRVEVTVLEDQAREPVVGATVSLVAFVETPAEPALSASAMTNEDGVATFTDVPVVVEGHAVSMSVTAALSEATTEDGCTITQAWDGESEATARAGTTAIEVDASRSESADCEPPGPSSPVLAGRVVGPDGAPFAVDAASISMHRADGGSWTSGFDVAADGSFSIRLEPWGTPDAPADLLLHVLGTVVAKDVDGDCTRDYAPEARLDARVQLAAGARLQPLLLQAALVQVGEVCSTRGTPKPTTSGGPKPTTSGGPNPSATAPGTPTAHPAGGGRPTLPPTDRLTERMPVGEADLVAALGLLLFGAALAFASTWRATRRRR
jgi:hypothetical protein